MIAARRGRCLMEFMLATQQRSFHCSGSLLGLVLTVHTVMILLPCQKEAFSSTTAAKRLPVRLSVTQKALCSRACVSPGICFNNKYFNLPQTEVQNDEFNPSINRCVKTHWAGSFGFA